METPRKAFSKLWIVIFSLKNMTLLELHDVEISKWQANIQPNEFSNYSNFMEIHPINIPQN